MSSRFSTEADERKLHLFINSLSEIASLHPSSSDFFNLIKEGIEDSLQRLVSREKFKNISLVDTLMKAKNEHKKEKCDKEAAENRFIENQAKLKEAELSLKQMKESQVNKMHQAKKEIQDKLAQKESEYTKLKKDHDKLEYSRVTYSEQIEWLKNREEEIIKRMDLNEIDLVTERLGIYGLNIDAKPLKPKPKYHSKIPKLDLRRLLKMREEDNDEDYEEEEEEAEEDVKSSQKKFFQDGSALVSDDSFERREELKHRKEQVIALLNKTYGDEESIAPVSSFEKSK